MSDPRFGTVTAAVDLLAEHTVDFVLVGGAAVQLHGSAYITEDVDFCCDRQDANLANIASALNSVNARFRVQGLPEGQQVHLDARWLSNGDSFGFITDIGNIDVRFHVDGIGDYDDVRAQSNIEDFEKRRIQVLSIDGLIQSKRAMGRPRDLLVLPELEMMRESIRVASEIAAARDAGDIPVDEHEHSRDDIDEGNDREVKRER